MTPAKDIPVAAGNILNTSHIRRHTKHGYASFVNVLPAYFAGKYWCFYRSGDRVREPCRIDPHKESISLFTATPEIITKTWADVFLSVQPQWYEVESDEIKDSSITYLPLMEDILDIVCERGSFTHSLVDLEPSREEIITLAIARVSEVYSKVEDVSAIYVSRYLDDITITVLLQDTKYSRSLMDNLFEIEYTLHKQNPSLIMEFLYLPRLYENRADVIHPKADLIYDRETSVILSSSSVSSAT